METKKIQTHITKKLRADKFDVSPLGKYVEGITLFLIYYTKDWERLFQEKKWLDDLAEYFKCPVRFNAKAPFEIIVISVEIGK